MSRIVRAVKRRNTAALCCCALFLYVLASHAGYWMAPVNSSPPRKLLEQAPLHVVIARDRGDTIDVYKWPCEGPRRGRNPVRDAVVRCMSLAKTTYVEMNEQIGEGEYVSVVLEKNTHLPDDVFARFDALTGDEVNGELFKRAKETLRPWLLTAGKPPGAC